MFVLFNIKLDDNPLTLIPSIIFGDNLLVIPELVNCEAGEHQYVTTNLSPSCTNSYKIKIQTYTYVSHVLYNVLVITHK